MKPLVSVCMPTYNQEKYIARAVQGVLSQEVDFEFELLIGEDESSDHTRMICCEYANANPDVIRLVPGRRADVIRIKGRETGRANLTRLLSQVRGRYVAICEGDDYWTEPAKLMRQVSFLESHPEYSFCFHDVVLVNENDEIIAPQFVGIPQSGDYALSNFLKHNRTATCSKLFRASTILPPPAANNVLAYDWLLSIHSGEQGKIYYQSGQWGAYRVSHSGLWHRMGAIEMEEASLEALAEIDKFFDHKYRSLVLPELIKRKKGLSRQYLKGRKPLRSVQLFLESRLLMFSQLVRRDRKESNYSQ
jgi:glycosyltransferase involved in cell wall biosynthesis